MSAGSFLRKRILEPLRRAQGTPESIARGGALGMWIALTPTVGIQSFMVVALALPMQANVPVGLVMCWITNPLTLIPFYFSYYWLGTLILGLPAGSYVGIRASLSAAMADISEHGLLESGGLLDAMATLGHEIVWPMTVGSLVIATLATWPTYKLFLRIFRRRRERALLEELEHARVLVVQGEQADPLSERPRDEVHV